MIPKIPLKFMTFDFHDCYYYWSHLDDEWYTQSQYFDRARKEFHPADHEPNLGELLSLQEWTTIRKPTEPPKHVLLQVIHAMPISVDTWGQQKPGQFLHALVVKLWAVREENSFMGFFGRGRTHLEGNKSPTCLYVVLDRPFHFSAIHLFKRGHLGLLLDLETADELLATAERSHLRVEVTFQYNTVRTGLTHNEATRNMGRHVKALNIRFALSYFQSCFVTLNQADQDPAQTDTSILLLDHVQDSFCNLMNGQPSQL